MVSKHVIPSVSSIVLSNFWKKLMSEQVYFSACGICRVDRRLLISVNEKIKEMKKNIALNEIFHPQIAASVTTYLVILLQFKYWFWTFSRLTSVILQHFHLTSGVFRHIFSLNSRNTFWLSKLLKAIRTNWTINTLQKWQISLLIFTILSSENTHWF